MQWRSYEGARGGAGGWGSAPDLVQKGVWGGASAGFGVEPQPPAYKIQSSQQVSPAASSVWSVVRWAAVLGFAALSLGMHSLKAPPPLLIG